VGRNVGEDGWSREEEGLGKDKGGGEYRDGGRRAWCERGVEDRGERWEGRNGLGGGGGPGQNRMEGRPHGGDGGDREFKGGIGE